MIFSLKTTRTSSTIISTFSRIPGTSWRTTSSLSRFHDLFYNSWKVKHLVGDHWMLVRTPAKTPGPVLKDACNPSSTTGNSAQTPATLKDPWRPLTNWLNILKDLFKDYLYLYKDLRAFSRTHGTPSRNSEPSSMMLEPPPWPQVPRNIFRTKRSFSRPKETSSRTRISEWT